VDRPDAYESVNGGSNLKIIFYFSVKYIFIFNFLIYFLYFYQTNNTIGIQYRRANLINIHIVCVLKAYFYFRSERT